MCITPGGGASPASGIGFDFRHPGLYISNGMISPIIYAAWVFMAQTLLYIALPLWATRNHFKNRKFLSGLSVALFMGLVSQACLGSAWQLLLPGLPLMSCLFYLSGWCLVGFLPSKQEPRTPGDAFPLKERNLIIIILMAGVIIRLIHPLQTPALGQSDAYTHLNMLRNLYEGKPWEAGYPPAFSRILLLPCVLFKIDPYYMARFGGAFFGVGLALTSAWMVYKCSGSSIAAVLCCLLISCFPGFNLLLKTGVGVFPNQLGLLMLPGIFVFCCPQREKHQERCRLFQVGIVCFLGLFLFVPMMLFHIFWIGVGVFLLWYLPVPRHVMKYWLGAIFLTVLGLLLFLSLVHLYLPQELLGSQVRILISGGETADGVQGLQNMSVAQALRLLVQDYFSLKRIGLGAVYLNLAAGSLGAFFLGILWFGMWRRFPLAVLLGVWGAVTLLQTVTGFAQFTAYQREGWSLLLATGIAGGWLGSVILDKWPVLSPLLHPGIGLIILSSVLYPPQHILTNSTAEEEWVSLTRWLRNGGGMDAKDPIKPFTTELRNTVNRDKKLYIVTRPLLQEDMFKAVLGPSEKIEFSDLYIWKNYQQSIPAASQVLLLLDSQPERKRASQSVFSSVSPEATEMFAEQEYRSYLFNLVLEKYVLGLDPDEFEVLSLPAPPGIKAYFVRKIPSELTEES